ncbi:MAG: 16S rRNA (adenine(1518)-N(6)/adenine(1519)-N(6))-dimethyltransferase RsmA [Ruminococcaceae bacterium]|nr:16S rRNA (adenine(1518)-N(6)/adenine(1519)-N(6))-dimethyltransferase RsmA [Oscillospiraceae bacterium]
MLNLCDPKTIRQVMDMFGLNFKKEFGQNFLTDNMTVEDIADACNDDKDITVVEIGPGIGCMTRELCERYSRVVAFEIDSGLIPVLKYTLDEYKNVTVLNQDIMTADLESVLAPYFEMGKVAVCANLPYYITTPILMKLIESKLPFDSITVMVQAEVAERLAAGAGNKNCGAITAAIDYYGHAELLFTVNADRFMPPPKVNSSVVRIDLWKDKPVVPIDEELFFKTVKAAFEQRRKTLPNSLMTGFSEISKERLTELIISCGHRPDVRGEKLSVRDFCTLSDAIYHELNK